MIFSLQSGPLSHLLFAVVLLPLVIGFALMLFPARWARKYADALGIGTVIFVLGGALALWNGFVPDAHGYGFFSSVDLGLEIIGARLQLGLNALSMPMFLLTAIVGAAAGFYAYQVNHERKGLFWALLLIIFSGILGAFASVDLFYSFLFHELALLPTLLALMIFGGPNRRQTVVESGIFMLIGSLVMLVGLLYFKFSAGLQSFSLLEIRNVLPRIIAVMPQGCLIGWMLVLAGVVVLSGLWPFYSWVPRLLEESPTSVAMLQGGALKFFGLYFLLQGFGSFGAFDIFEVRAVVSVLCVAAILLLGLAALAQGDLCRRVTYAVMMHTGVLFLAFAAGNATSLGGLVLSMVGAGFSTALLLMLCSALHRRTQTLQLADLSGLRATAPRLAMFLMVGWMAVIALPCFINFLGEFAIVAGLWQAHFISVAAVLLGLLITAGFGLRALGNVLMGPAHPTTLVDLTSVERFCAWLITVPLILFAFFPGLLTTPLNPFLTALLKI